MKISLVIPTRERAHLLTACLDACLAVDDAAFEIVVSDNASADDTEAVVAARHDPRLVYVRTDRRVSMRANFENGLNAAGGDYVVFIGDDDCVLPAGMRTLRALIERHRPDAIGWRLVNFEWPSSETAEPAGSLALAMKAVYGELARRDPRAALDRFARARIASYKDGANLYHGCVSRAVIERARAPDGVYFRGQIPDVYAAIANLNFVDTFLWVRHPLSLGGTSDASNGGANIARRRQTRAGEEETQRFMREAESDPVGRETDVRIRSVEAHVLNMLVLANETVYGGALAIDHAAWFARIARDLAAGRKDFYEDGIGRLRGFAGPRGLADAVERAVGAHPHSGARIAPLAGERRSLASGTRIRFCGREGPRDIAEAAALTEQVLGAPHRPARQLTRLSLGGLRRWRGALGRARAALAARRGARP